MAQPISFRWDEQFVARIDEARGLVPRSAFVRSAVEQALSGTDEEPPGSGVASSRVEAAPAERPYRQHVPGPDVGNVRSSVQSKRDVRPIPKRGK